MRVPNGIERQLGERDHHLLFGVIKWCLFSIFLLFFFLGESVYDFFRLILKIMYGFFCVAPPLRVRMSLFILIKIFLAHLGSNLFHTLSQFSCIFQNLLVSSKISLLFFKQNVLPRSLSFSFEIHFLKPILIISFTIHLTY